MGVEHVWKSKFGTAVGVLTGLVMVVALLVAIYLICGQYGLIPGLDFGCGQYYYTDIPGWERYFSVAGIVDDCPLWVYYVLFAIWGWAMYRLWRWIDASS